MNYFEKEMRSLFADSDLISNQKYCGKTMLGKLDDELRVKLQFVTTNIGNHYNAIRAQIINRTEGQIDSQMFRFTDILGSNPMCRDNGITRDIYIWDDGDPEWYIYHPSPAAKEKIAETISDYLSLYQSEDMQMTL